jgi:hypothetical protein
MIGATLVFMSCMIIYIGKAHAEEVKWDGLRNGLQCKDLFDVSKIVPDFTGSEIIDCLYKEHIRTQVLQKQVEELKGKPCEPPAPVSEPEKLGNPLKCETTAFRGYDERNNTYNDFLYLKSKEPRFNDTEATWDSKKWFHCHTLYQAQVRNHRDP